MKKENMRKINYFDTDIEILASHEYVATDADGRIFAFKEKPARMKETAGSCQPENESQQEDR